MRVIHLCRKPLSEASVAANVLKHGCGGLNIDASRIGTGSTMRSQKPQNNGQSMNNGQWKGGATGSTKGRWPANVILQHLDGCRCDGVKKIKGSPKPYVRDTEVKNRLFGKGAGLQEKGYQTINYADTDGKETVANWICAEGCPVKALDEQSGTLTSGKPSGTRNRDSTMFGQARGNGAALTGFGDKGGASRFFKQVGDSHE